MFQGKKREGCLIFKANAFEKFINKPLNLTQLMCTPTAVSQVLEMGKIKLSKTSCKILFKTGSEPRVINFSSSEDSDNWN